MYRILDCLTIDHDPALVWLAVGVCVLSALSTLAISERVLHSEHRRAWLWLLAVGAGSGVWVTHFIAMLGYQVDLPTTYAPGLTTLSYVAGVAVIGLGFRVAHHRRISRAGPAAGGAIVGIGVTVLHYLGIAAAHFPADSSTRPTSSSPRWCSPSAWVRRPCMACCAGGGRWHGPGRRCCWS